MQVLHLALMRQSFTFKLKKCGEKAAENAHAEEFTALKRPVTTAVLMSSLVTFPNEAHVKLLC